MRLVTAVAGSLLLIIAVGLFLLTQDEELLAGWSSWFIEDEATVVEDAEEDSTEFDRGLFEEWLRLNRNKPVLLVQADDRRLSPETPLSQSPVHSSIVANRYWADLHGYAHIWVTGTPEGPYQRVIAGYWNKVPASMLALRLARRANISSIVFLDSDTIPTQFFVPEKVCSLPTMQQRYASNFILSREREHWSRLISNLKVYNETVNSGAFMFDTSVASERLLRHWWLTSTNQSTPFEIQRSSLIVNFTVTSSQVLDERPAFALDLKALAEALREKFGYAFIVRRSDFLKHSETKGMWSIRFEIAPSQPWPHGKFFLEFKNKCCGKETACGQLVQGQEQGILRVSQSCESIPHNTMWEWPGDQDRLNWLVNDYFKQTRIVDDLSLCIADEFVFGEPCFQHFCHKKSTTYIGDSLWKYLTKYDDDITDRVEWDTHKGPELLDRVWKIHTTTKCMEDGSELNDELFRFERMARI